MTQTGDPSPDAGGQTGGAGQSPSADAGGDGSPAPDSYTQEQVASLLRSERAKAAARFSDYDQIKTRLTELEQASQTELEKAQSQAKEASDRADQATATAHRLVKRDAIVSAAARAGAIDPEIVAVLLADSITIEDGNVTQDVNKLVTALLEERPFLKANGTKPVTGTVDGGAHTRSPSSAKTTSQQMDDVLRANR